MSVEISSNTGDVKKEISALKEYFKTVDLKNRCPFSLNKGEVIMNSKQFLDSHFQIVESQSHNNLFEPYLDRLRLLNHLILKQTEIFI